MRDILEITVAVSADLAIRIANPAAVATMDDDSFFCSLKPTNRPTDRLSFLSTSHNWKVSKKQKKETNLFHLILSFRYENHQTIGKNERKCVYEKREEILMTKTLKVQEHKEFNKKLKIVFITWKLQHFSCKHMGGSLVPPTLCPSLSQEMYFTPSSKVIFLSSVFSK